MTVLWAEDVCRQLEASRASMHGSDEPPACKHECHDLKPTEADCNWWELHIEGGAIDIRCAACGCTYEPLCWDGYELTYTDQPIPVRVQFEYCGSEWHGLDRCDHGWTIGVTPRKN